MSPHSKSAFEIQQTSVAAPELHDKEGSTVPGDAQALAGPQVPPEFSQLLFLGAPIRITIIIIKMIRNNKKMPPAVIMAPDEEELAVAAPA